MIRNSACKDFLLVAPFVVLYVKILKTYWRYMNILEGVL